MTPTERRQARRELVSGPLSWRIPHAYRFSLEIAQPLEEALILEPAADGLDSLLCAVQAARAFGRRDLGVPEDCATDEGWILDSQLLGRVDEA